MKQVKHTTSLKGDLPTFFSDLLQRFFSQPLIFISGSFPFLPSTQLGSGLPLSQERPARKGPGKRPGQPGAQLPAPCWRQKAVALLTSAAAAHPQ